MSHFHFLFIFLMLLFSGCKQSSKVVQLEAGVEAELNSEESFVLDFGERVIAETHIGVATLSNSGKFAVTDLVATPLDEKGNLAYTGGAFPGTNGTCTKTIAHGAKCTIEFEFKPDHEGNYSYNIDLDYSTGISAKKKTLTVKGYAGSAAFLKFDDESDYDFGVHETSEQVEKTYTIKNEGGLTAREVTPNSMETPFYYKGGSFPGTGGTCGKKIPAYSSCTIVVVLTPTIVENAVKNISLDYFNGNGKITLSVSFQALIVSIEADLAILVSGTQDFGSTTLLKGVAKQFKVMNKGYKDATDLNFIGSTNFLPGSDTCAGKVEKSKFCVFTVIFTPTVAAQLTEDYTLNFNTGKQIKSLTLSASGKGITPAILNFDILNINDFGNQGVNSEKSLQYTIKNMGNFTASGVNIISTSPDFIIQSNTCLAIMLKNSSCVVKVKFTPTTVGNKTGDLVISYNNGSSVVSSTQTLTGQASPLAYLKFTGSDPVRGYDFGVVPNGGRRQFRVLVTNTGLADATNVKGPSSFFIPDFYYNGDFDPTANGKTVMDYPICNNVLPGDVCRNPGGTSLYSTENILPESYIDGTPYPPCSVNPGTICALNLGANPGVHRYPGTQVIGDFPTCGDTILKDQTCQIVVEFFPADSQSNSINMFLDYVNDGLVQTDSQRVSLNVTSQSLATLSYSVNNIIDDVTKLYTIPSAYNIGEKILQIIIVTNNGDYGAFFNSIDWADPLQDSFSFNKNLRPGVAPGIDDLGNNGSCSPNGYLGGHSSCSVYIWFAPQNAGNPLSEVLTINYNDGTADVSHDLTIIGVAAPMGEFELTPLVGSLTTNFDGVKLDPVAVQLPGNNVARKITIKNKGLASFKITDIKFCNGLLDYSFSNCITDFTEGVIDTAAPESCLNKDVSADSVDNTNSTCSLDVLYSPQSVHSTNFFTIMLTYDSAGINVKKHIYGQLDSADPTILKFTDSGALGTTPYDFKLVEYLESSPADLKIDNTSGAINASSISFSIIDDDSNAFSLDPINDNCTSDLGFSQTCTVRVNFTPNSIGSFTAKLRADYFDGQKNTFTLLPLKGAGEPPRSIQMGWSQIIAIGDKVNTSNVSDSLRFIQLQWNSMTPKDGYTITGYNIYRRSGDGFYGGGSADDYTTPMNSSPISTATRTYKDTQIEAGRVYYYEVRPIILGFPSRTLEKTREVRVTAPFPNMILIHRWMANTLMCQKLGKTQDLSNNGRCSYPGIGSTSTFFDLGYDLMVDRFELGADKTSKPGQIPLKDTQINMQANCDAQRDSNGSEFSVFNISKTVSSLSFKKRIMSRKEFEVAAFWDPTYSDATISSREAGTTASNNCNGASGSIVETTGNNSQCKSYFGVEDAAGNEMEWVSDRIINGVGITDQMNSDAGSELRLDPANRDLAGVDFTNLVPSSAPTMLMKDAPCFTIPLGLSIPLNPNTGTCLNAKVTTSLGQSYFHGNNYSVSSYSDMKGLGSGGAAYLAGSSGVYSSYWLGVNTAIGARCAIKLNY